METAKSATAAATSAEKELQDAEKRMQEAQSSLVQEIESEQRTTREYRTIEEARNALVARKKELAGEQKKVQSQEAEVSKKEEKLQSEVRDLKAALFASMPPHISSGLSKVQEYMQTHDVPGYYGTLLDLMELDKEYATAVQATAGNDLLNVVVADDNTAAELIQVLNRSGTGRLTFLPLSRLRPSRPKVPGRREAIPMQSIIRYDEKYEKAFAQVFGSTVIVQTKEVGSQVRREFDVQAVTLDGTKFSKKGTMSGGYFDPRKSRIELQKKLRTAQSSLAACSKSEVQAAAQRINQEMSRVLGDIQKKELEMQRLKSDDSLHSMRAELREQIRGQQSE